MTVDAELTSWTAVSPLADLLLRSATLAPHRHALILPEVTYTYAELLRRAMETAKGLLALGIRPRQNVGILAHNGIELVEAIFGVALMGAVAVPINARHKTAELSYIAENGELAAVLTLGASSDAYVDFTELLTTAFPGLERQHDPTALALPQLPALKAVVALNGAGRAGVLERTAFVELAERIEDVEVHRQRSRVQVRDAAIILYTSGTTANPKGCVLSHEALTRGAVSRAKTRYGAGGIDVTWGAGPLYHVGCLSPFIGSIGAAGTYLTDVFFDPGRAIALMTREKPTVAFPWFPAIMQGILDHPAYDPAALETLRTILLIGPRPLIELVQDTFPNAELIAACGMTETAGIYAVSDRWETTQERSEAQGKACLGIELRIVDVLIGDDLPDGEMGEILIRGYTVMTEYYRDPEKTALAIDAEGWLHSGDLYSRTPDGRLIFHGRLKDMLKVGGENVATIEIESFLCKHPAVRMASAIGRPDPRLDEVPVAFVELERGHSATAEELIAFCRGKISSYKVPADIFFIEGTDWPMSTTKIDKRGLRALLEQLRSPAT